jgi:hypothetical protein
MPDERTVKKLFQNALEGKRAVGQPRKRWSDNTENDLKRLSVRG